MSTEEIYQRAQLIKASGKTLPEVVDALILEPGSNPMQVIMLIKWAYDLGLHEAKAWTECRCSDLKAGIPMIDFNHCPICGQELPDEITRYNIRRYQLATCQSQECIDRQKELTKAQFVKRFGCCEKAEPMPCVCSYAFKCPEHGERHYGTHD